MVISPFSLDLGTVIFALSYKNVSLGLGTGTDTKLVSSHVLFGHPNIFFTKQTNVDTWK